MNSAALTTEPKTNWRPAVTLELPKTERPLSEPPSLTQVVQEAVRGIDEDALHRVARLDAGLVFQPKALLGLLVYCYARETYSSEEVEDMLRRDKPFRDICHEEFPGARHFRQFRRHNREAIRVCLVAALGFLVRQKVELGIVTKVSEAHLEEEANRRITNAMFIDSMEPCGV